MLSSAKTGKEPVVRVKVHNSPPASTPRNPPSPGMIPRFSYEAESTKPKTMKNVKSPSSIKTASTSNKESSRISAKSPRVNFKTVQKPISRQTQTNQKVKGAPLQRNVGLTRSLINMTGTSPPKQPKRPQTAGDKPDLISESFQHLLTSKYPPYNPDEFVPGEPKNSDTQEQVVVPKSDKDLLTKIREELNEWTSKCEKKNCPEEWTSVAPEYINTQVKTPTQQKRSSPKGKMTSRRNISTQKTTDVGKRPPESGERKKPDPSLNLSFLNNSSVITSKGPKTPSPLLKSKVLDVADKLLSEAERGFDSVESKLSSHMLSSKNSSRISNVPLSARRTMSNLQTRSIKESDFTTSTLGSRSKVSYKIPQNSPNKIKDNENYRISNGEKKGAKLRHFHNTQLKSNSDHYNLVKSASSQEKIPVDNISGITPLAMFHEGKHVKTQAKDSTTVLFKSSAEVFESKSNTAMKHDVETNTEPILSFKSSTMFKNSPNSSIINMKTNKPEPEEICIRSTKTKFNVQRMPSVNIRPEFTIHAGPKINIVASKPAVISPKRKNAEFFDVVYPQRTFTSNVTETGRNIQYICDRHIFPSGKLVPGYHEDPRKTFQDKISVDEKQELLIGLIKSLVEKIEKQTSEKKNCCRLSCSLPLLASVVSKIQLDCVKCVDTLSRNLDRLIQLVKEELRSPKAISGDHCCQLHETVQYQIVELELMQDENCKPRADTNTVRFFRHQDDPAGEEIGPKKTVSFDSLQKETVRPASSRSARGSTLETTKRIFPPNPSKKVVGNQHKSVLKAQSVARTVSGKSIPFARKGLMSKNENKIVNKPTTGYTKTLTTSVRGAGPKTFSRTNPQVVGKLLDNLPRRGALSNNSSKEPVKENTKDASNELIKVISSKETTNEFDQWVQERSFKIQKIHEELSKIVEDKVNTYETSEPSMHLRFPQTIEKEPKPRNISIPDDFDRYEGANGQPHPGTLSQERVLSVQEVGQDYTEDFEDDEEELSTERSIDSDAAENGGDSKNSKEENFAEIENGSSSEIENVTVFSQTEDNSLSEMEGSVNNVEKKENTLLLHKQNQSKYISVTSDRTNDSRSHKNIPIKVDTASSPISTFLLANEPPSRENVPNQNRNSSKKSVSTSPIKLEDEVTVNPTTVSKNVQTDVVDNSKSKRHTSDNLQLSVPSLKLVPSPIENVLKLSLCSSGENSLALETQGSNQPMKFIVQLPTLPARSMEEERINHEKFAVNRDDIMKGASNKSEYQHSLQRDNQASSSKNALSERVPTENSTGNQYLQTFDANSLKDIIEPTVSEVLKKIQSSNSNPSSSSLPTVFERTQNNQIELVKPNIIYQSKQTQIKRCEITPAFTVVDVETPKPKVDSSNQTEAERLSIQVQVAESLTGSVGEKIMSARNGGTIETSRSYLEMLLPPPPTAEFSRSTESSSHSSSTTHSSASSSSSSKRSDCLKHSEKLSEGEIPAESCSCMVGEVCEVCVPRLDLSFSELKTKPKQKRRGKVTSSSESDYSQNLKSDLFLSNLPQGLEPKPPSSKEFCSVTGMKTFSLENKPRAEASEVTAEGNQRESNLAFNRQAKIVSHNFSEIANLVLNDLRIEGLKTTTNDPKLPRSSTSRSSSVARKFSIAIQPELFSSSDSAVSSKSALRANSRKGISKTKSKKSLVIKSPEEVPKIDAVIEGSEDVDGEEEVSLSSYQTSVTSVSVENLALGLSSQSQSSSETHLPSAV